MKLPAEITDQEVDVRSGVKNNRSWEIRTMKAWVKFPNKQYPIECKFTLPRDVQSYPNGKYQAVGTPETTNFGELTAKFKLVPIAVR